MSKIKLFLDMDGVLSDFDSHARATIDGFIGRDTPNDII